MTLDDAERMVAEGVPVTRAAAAAGVSSATLRRYLRRHERCTGPECQNPPTDGPWCHAHYAQRRRGMELQPLGRRENRARALVDEWRHMRDICGLHPAHALLTIGVGPGSMARSHERIGEDVPLELKRLYGKSTAELHAALDKRTWVA